MNNLIVCILKIFHQDEKAGSCSSLVMNTIEVKRNRIIISLRVFVDHMKRYILDECMFGSTMNN